MLIQRNVLLEWQTSESQSQIERVLWVGDVNTGVWSIDVNDSQAWPVHRRYEDIELDLAKGSVRILKSLNTFLAKLLPDDAYLKKHSERAKRNYSLIAPLVEGDDPDIFNRNRRGRMVTDLAEQSGCRKALIYSTLCRYWQGGCVPNALLPEYYRRGQIKIRQEHYEKVGRPSKSGRRVTAEDKRLFQRGIDDYKKTGKAKKLTKVWELTLGRYFNIGYEKLSDGTLVPIVPPDGERLSYNQFKNWYYKNRNQKSEIIAIDGEKAFESNNRPTLGDETHTASGPGAVYQIDAFIGDIYLRCYMNRKRIIGRPVIYIVVDVFSRLIVGFAVTLEGPSWAGAKLALENAFSNKVTFCRQFGIEITEADWPVEGKNEALTGDNGELAGYNANSLIDEFDIRVTNAPTDRPDLKGIVESRYPIIKGLAIEWVPGAVRPTKKRRGKDYRLDATLDLNQFRRLMIECILIYNNSRRLESYRMSLPMIADGVEPIPIKIWSWGMKKLTGRLRSEDDMEALRIKLLPRDTASVTSDGIRFRGVHYTCERAIEEQWFLRLKGTRSRRVDIVYESLVDRIYLRLGKGRYELCVLTPADKRFEGCDWYEVLEYFALKKKAAEAAETDQLQAAAKIHAKAERIVSEAEEMNKAALADDDRSKSSRLRGVRENRHELKLYERKHGTNSSPTANLLRKPKPAVVIPIAPANPPKSGEDYVAPARPYDELRRSRKKAKKHGNR